MNNDLFRSWLRKTILHPWILRNKPESTLVLRDTIVYQMHHAGITWQNINKWLETMKLPTIKSYTMTPKGPRIYYKTLTSEERKNITTPLVHIA